MKKAIVIGAGIAGLASAVRLAARGWKVHVFDKNSYPGGKLTAFTTQGYRFDAGPSLFTMPELVLELFNIAGKDPEGRFQYISKEVACEYFWNDSTRLTAYTNKDKFAEEVEEKLDVDGSLLLKYLKRSAKKFNLTKSIFLEQSLHKLGNYLSTDVLKALFRAGSLNLTSTMHRANERSFKNRHLTQLFDRYATYNGSDPYRAPGLLTLIPHLEMNQGTYFPKEGMHAITESVYQLSLDLGVEYHFEEPVKKIVVEKKKATGVETEKDTYQSDLVVCNMDVVPAYTHLLGRTIDDNAHLKQERSSSALIFYWGIDTTFDELDLHNIFFADNYEGEFKTIFKEDDVVDDPTIYINITSKNKLSDAPEGCENWFVMINVPGNKGQDWDKIIDRSRKNIKTKISRILNRDIEKHIVTEDILDPRSIESKTYSYQGSLYGSSSNSMFSAFLRHPNFSREIKDLYFCGGSVHPGGGIPLCLLSAKIVDELIHGKS